MRIYKFKDFIKLPVGTVWSYYTPCVFGGLNVKCSDDSYMDFDFLFDEIVGAFKDRHDGSVFDLLDSGGSVDMDFNSTVREGMFDENQLYAVYEKEDLAMLVKRLSDALDKYK